MASIRDVAKKANVAASTVSRVLNDNGYVSQDARIKIEKAMQELHYTPNELARNLYHKKNHIVGVIVPDISHPFFSTFTKYVEMELYENGYKTMICNTIQRSNRERDYLDMLNRRIVDGIITGAHSLELEEYAQVRRPMVCLDRTINEDFPVVGSNHRQGGVLAAQKLTENGCRQVVQIEGTQSKTMPAHDRHTYFRQYMEDHHVRVDSIRLPWNRFDYSGFAEIAEQVMEQYPRADGIFAADMPAAACLKAALKRGRRVPEDLKIVSYDGTYVTEIDTMTITTIVQPIAELAKSAAQTILALINGQTPVEHYQLLDVRLREGDTTI